METKCPAACMVKHICQDCMLIQQNIRKLPMVDEFDQLRVAQVCEA